MANRFFTILIIPEKTSKVRKLVLRAVTSRRELATDPSRLRLEDVAAVLRKPSAS